MGFKELWNEGTEKVKNKIKEKSDSNKKKKLDKIINAEKEKASKKALEEANLEEAKRQETKKVEKIKAIMDGTTPSVATKKQAQNLYQSLLKINNILQSSVLKLALKNFSAGINDVSKSAKSTLAEARKYWEQESEEVLLNEEKADTRKEYQTEEEKNTAEKEKLKKDEEDLKNKETEILKYKTKKDEYVQAQKDNAQKLKDKESYDKIQTSIDQLNIKKEKLENQSNQETNDRKKKKIDASVAKLEKDLGKMKTKQSKLGTEEEFNEAEKATREAARNLAELEPKYQAAKREHRAMLAKLGRQETIVENLSKSEKKKKIDKHSAKDWDFRAVENFAENHWIDHNKYFVKKLEKLGAGLRKGLETYADNLKDEATYLERRNAVETFKDKIIYIDYGDPRCKQALMLWAKEK